MPTMMAEADWAMALEVFRASLHGAATRVATISFSSKPAHHLAGAARAPRTMFEAWLYYGYSIYRDGPAQRYTD